MSKQKSICLMGASDSGKTSMSRVCFENWEPARTQYQGKTSHPEREDIFLFGRKLFSFVDCGGQVSYFDDYLKDPFLFNNCAALVFVVDITVFFLASSQDEATAGNAGGGSGGGGNSGGGGGEGGRTWTPQTIRDTFARTVTVLKEKSPDARVFVLLNKMDKVPSATANLDRDQIEQVMTETARKLQRTAIEASAQAMRNIGRDPALAVSIAVSAVAHGDDATNNPENAAADSQNNNDENNGPAGDASDNNHNNTGDQHHQQQGDAEQQQHQPQEHNNNNGALVDTSGLSPTELDEIVPCYRTSIFNNSIVHAWSQVIVKLLKPVQAVAALRDWLEKIRANSNGEIHEVCILDSSTLLCIASSSAFSPLPLASECAIRAKRQRLKGLEYVTVTHPNYSLVWQTLLSNRLQLLLVGDGQRCTPGVTQLNAERIVEAFHARFVEDRMPPPWPEEVLLVKQLLHTM